MEFNEIGEEEPPEVDALSDSSIETTDDLIQSRGMGNEAPISASLGAMRPLVAKLDKLLLGHPTDRMRLFSDEVKSVSCYVDELSELEDPSRMAKCWMNEARDLSYDMEDSIDSLIFVQPAGASPVAEDIEAMVSEFSNCVQEAIERYKAYVLPDSAPSSTLRRRFVSFGPMLPTLYEDIVIIDGRMDEFIQSFAEDGDKQLKVVSILGSAGLGKTTLARVLYNKFGKKYGCRAFIRVSRKPDMKRIFRDMLWQLQRQEPPEYRNEPDLIYKIKIFLRNKRYLIIIDDVWASSVWDTINDALPKGSNGSRIVTTTQIEDVALICCCHQSEYVFEMQPLDDDHSRKLFFNRLFGSESDCPEIFQEVSNKIVEICDGLPFATISIASLLASQPVITEDLLAHIYKSLSSCFSAHSTSERTRQALNLSFNNLPHYLKTCLLYLGMYPEGYTFCNNDLIKQWMAEGFIHTIKGQDVEKVAESYLHQLIGRRFILPIRISYNNYVLSCAVHDMVHDLIAHMSAENNFIVAIHHSQKNVALSHKARRLSLLFGDARYAKTPENITNSQVRSLTYFGLLECMPCITEFKLLGVLVLQISGHGGKDNPVDLTWISELNRLRYLKIGCGICIKLPDGLKCLETLDVSDAIVTRSSWGFNVPHLLHLGLHLDESLGYYGSIMWSWDLAPSLNSLEHLYVTGTTSSFFDPGSFIQKQDNLRTVVFSHGSTDKNNVFSGAIKVITSKPLISSEAPVLQRLEMSADSGFPMWVKNHENLCILKITVKILDMDAVGILRGLRALDALSLHVLEEKSDKIIFDKAGFSALKYFKLRFMAGIAWIKFEEGAMPNLLKLKLVFNAVRSMDRHHFFDSRHAGGFEQYKQGNAPIVIDHMPSLKEISGKFWGAADDLERIKEIGISIDQCINPAIVNMQFVDSSLYVNQSAEQKQQEEILENDPADETLDKAAAKRSPESLYVFTLDELMSATDNFSSLTFQGYGYTYEERDLNRTFCFPGLYRGYLRTGLMPHSISVKCINKFSHDREWLMVDQTELEYLRALSCHPHLVKLLGFCDYYEHRMLVYESMPSKSLDQYLLHGDVYKLPWLTRLKIAVGTAKGLACLHGADKRMAQGDFKASDVLLDRNYKAKLSGYQLANENSVDKTLDGSLTVESDVYKFGAVLLELLTGRKAIDGKPLMGYWAPFQVRLVGARRDPVEWWRPYLSCEAKLHHVIDPSLKGEYSEHAAWITATIVLRCMHSIPEKRPSMREVVEALEPLPLLVDEDNHTNVDNEAGSGAGDGNKAGGSNWKVYSRYLRQLRGRHEFKLDELRSATSNFSEENLLCETDPGHVYKGAFGKLMVAVLKLRRDYDDWLPELQTIESMHQPHLLSLLGCCVQDGQCVLLVYEYMPRGSLSEINLSGISLSTRINIALGVAKGMSFLHESGKQMIYYTGFTASSILLDSDYTAKLWGFGPAKQTDVTVPVRMRQDVYNFGVVLAKLLVGKSHKNFDPLRELEWYSREHDSFQENAVVTIARRCLQEVPELRPSMLEVVDALDSATKQSRTTRWSPSVTSRKSVSVKGNPAFVKPAKEFKLSKQAEGQPLDTSKVQEKTIL